MGWGGFKAAWKVGGRGQDMVMGGSLGARGTLAGLGRDAVTGNPSSTAVMPSCPFFPQSTRPRPRQAAASLLEPRCAWRVGHVWPCQP